MLKLPRTSLEPHDIAAVESLFQADLRPVFDGSNSLISWLALDERIRNSFNAVARTGCFSRGLELIAKLLDDEKKGLVAVEERVQQPPTQRMSRLLFISNDGSERFYRQVASLLTQHGNRVWACHLDADAEALGRLIGVTSSKALMINDKKALALFLTGLVHPQKSI